MKANKFLVPALGIGLMLATVGIAQATGFWVVSGKQMIDTANMTSSADVRGWMTVEQIAQGLHVEVATVYALTGIPTDVPPGTALKDLEQIVPDFEVSSVRDALAIYLSEDPAEEAMPEEAVPEVASPTPTSVIEEATAVAPEPAAEPGAAGTPSADHIPLGEGSGTGDGAGLSEEGYLAGADIRGQHTLREIAERGQIPMDDLIAELGLLPETDLDMPVRDLVKEGVIDEVATLRSVVEGLQQD